YAAIQSDSFAYLGSEKLVGHTVAYTTQVSIRFPRHSLINVTEGQGAEITLKLRRPGERRLQLVDDRSGLPVEGVQVTRYLFWSNYNHCGAFSGVEELGMAVSDAAGYVPVPDGDVQYGFDFYKPHYDLTHPTEPSGELVARLSTPGTVIQLHQSKRKPL